MNFSNCIDNYRIEVVKKMFTNGEHKKTTLLVNSLWLWM
jgi:hypothetical protein